MKILITGATGFVGINIVNYLKLDYKIVAFVRDKDKARRLLGNDVEFAVGDINDEYSLTSALKRVDAVVHLAGMINASDLYSLYRVNRYGCRTLASACNKTGVNSVIYVSSLASRGPDGVGHPVSHYGYSKRLGELELIKLLFDKNLTILRPPIIYGPYDKGFFTLFKMAKRGVLPKLRRIYSLVFVRDLVISVERLLKYCREGVKIYYISGSRVNTDRLNKALFGAFSKRGVEVPIPEFLINSFSLFKFGSKAFSSDKIREIKPKAWTCDNKQLLKDTGFKPSIEIEEGFKITARWYEEHGWL